MTAGAFVGRLGPLAATFGVGAVVLLGGAGVAAADAADSDDPGPAAAHRSGSAPGSVAGRTARPERGFSRPGPARPPTGIVSRSAVATIADPEPGNAQGAVADPARPPQSESELPAVRPAPVVARAVQVNPEPAEAVSGPVPPVSAAAVAGNRIAPAAKTGSVVPQQLSAGATGTDPISSFFGGLAALFNNQTPRLNPTQLTQSPAGVVTGALGAVDPDSPRLTFTVAEGPVHGSAEVNADGSWTYTPEPAAAAAGVVDSFRVTVSDAASGFAIHGLAGLLNLLTFGLLGTRGDSSTSTVAVAVVATGPAVAPPVAPPVDPPVDPPGPLVAFHGAEGFGASATGGRDGSVIYVTNLNADGPGSLQWAVDQPGARYILFKVSGLIDTQIHLTNGDVTIAGQTSPGGITIRGLVTDETPYQDQTVREPSDFSENWILQHIRIRPGAGGPSDDGLRLRYTRNAIVDHVSIGNATDEAIEISYSNNITVQNTIIAETVGGHSFYGGVLMNYSNPAHGFALYNVSLHHNVFNRIEGRLPEGSRESAAAANSFMNLELSNNLYWDPRFFIALGVDTAVAGGQPIYWKLNAVNNYFRTANGFQFGMFDDQILNVARNELFVSGNRMSLYPARSDYQLFYCCNDYPSETGPDATSRRAQSRTSRHPFPEITYTPTDQLRSVLLNTAGAWPRYPMDIRLMQTVAADAISSAPIATNPANDALLPPYSGTAPAPPADTDNDGMPDTWETGKGLDPTVANTNARRLSTAGYTDLEVYLHELSTSRIGGSTV